MAVLLSIDAAPDLESADYVQLAETDFREAVLLRDRPSDARRLFRHAAAIYDHRAESGIRSPALYLNEGHAYLLGNDLPRAILAYRCGLRLAPNDHDLQRGLDYARQQVVYPATGGLGRQPVDPWPPWLPRPTRWPLLGLTAILYTLACLCLTRWAMTRRRRLLWLGGLAFGAAMLPVGVYGLLEWNEAQQCQHPLVVIAQNGVRLSKGNGPDYPFSYAEPVPRGVEARQRFVRGDWLQIELAGGEVGWVPRSAVVVDTTGIPSESHP
jgi:hypothetical protein